jgi:hypothetical protein
MNTKKKNSQLLSPLFAVLSLLSLSIILVLSSCGKDDTPAKSRDIKFEITGNFSGQLDATYITASGGATNESITSLPWTKSITYTATALSTNMTVGGGGGVAGQTLTIKVFAGGALVSTTPGTANSSGIVVVATPSYVF